MSFLPFSYSSTNSFLNAFERSFETFLQSNSAPAAQGQGFDENDPNSEKSISAILSTVTSTESNLSPFARATVGQTNARGPVAPKPSGRRSIGGPLVNIDLTQGRPHQENVGLDLTRRTYQSKPVEETPRAYTCGHCKKTFRKETTLSLHQCVVKDLKAPLGCSSCGKKFGSKASLDQHMCVSDEPVRTRRHSIGPVKTSRTKLTERVEIDVPVTLVTTEIIFQEPTGLALIVGDIIELDPGDITYEEAVIDGVEIERLATSRSVVTEVIEAQQEVLPDAVKQMALHAGLTVEDLDDIFSHLPEDPEEVVGKHQETVDQETQEKVEEIEDDRRNVLTLEESAPVTPISLSSRKLKTGTGSVSLQKFTYFNDSPHTVVDSQDDSDEDWALTKIKCKLCKKVFSSKSQYRKHLKTHSKAKKTPASSGKGPQKCLEKMLTLEEF